MRRDANQLNQSARVVQQAFGTRPVGDFQLNKPVLPRATRLNRGLRFLVGVGILALGGARVGYLAWPLAGDVLSSTLQQAA
jgi:hypothetical protein